MLRRLHRHLGGGVGHLKPGGQGHLRLRHGELPLVIAQVRQFQVLNAVSHPAGLHRTGFQRVAVIGPSLDGDSISRAVGLPAHRIHRASRGGEGQHLVGGQVGSIKHTVNFHVVSRHGEAVGVGLPFHRRHRHISIRAARIGKAHPQCRGLQIVAPVSHGGKLHPLPRIGGGGMGKAAAGYLSAGLDLVRAHLDKGGGQVHRLRRHDEGVGIGSRLCQGNGLAAVGRAGIALHRVGFPAILGDGGDGDGLSLGGPGHVGLQGALVEVFHHLHRIGLRRNGFKLGGDGAVFRQQEGAPQDGLAVDLDGAGLELISTVGYRPDIDLVQGRNGAVFVFRNGQQLQRSVGSRLCCGCIADFVPVEHAFPGIDVAVVTVYSHRLAVHPQLSLVAEAEVQLPYVSLCNVVPLLLGQSQNSIRRQALVSILIQPQLHVLFAQVSSANSYHKIQSALVAAVAGIGSHYLIRLKRIVVGQGVFTGLAVDNFPAVIEQLRPVPGGSLRGFIIQIKIGDVAVIPPVVVRWVERQGTCHHAVQPELEQLQVLRQRIGSIHSEVDPDHTVV